MAEENVEPLITECPNCQTRFRVTESQLQIAAGRVRCGACLTVFQGVEHLLWDNQHIFENESEAQAALDELLDELGTPGSRPGRRAARDDERSAQAGADVDQSDLDAALDEPIGIDWDSDEDWSEPAHQLYGGHEEPSNLAPEELQRIEQRLAGEKLSIAGSEAQAEPLPDAGPGIDSVADHADIAGDELSIDELTRRQADEIVVRAADAREAPAPARRMPERQPALAKTAEPGSRHFAFGPEPSKRRWWVTLATMAALLALIAQVLWYQFATWSRDPDLRPVYGVICAVLGCELPVMRDIDRLLAQNLIVRSHPEVANALLVDAIIVNQAPFPQPFPVLELRFTSMDGNLVAGRRFQPQEYLAGQLAGATVMQSQTPIHVELEIEDPGIDAVNYFLTFR